jgi:hypothetical protein
VAVVFAREITPPLTGLVKKLDEATLQNDVCQMGSFVVLLSDDKASTAKQLKELARKEKLKETALTIFDSKGPTDYHIAGDADVTVLLYVGKVVKVNHAYRKGEFSEKEVDKILADLPQILPKN